MWDRDNQSHTEYLGISEAPKGVTVMVRHAVYITEVLLSASLHVGVGGDTAHASILFISILLDCLPSGQYLSDD